MKLRSLVLENFGPFKHYEISFLKEDSVCLLLTGKNNEGKSSILFAIKLLASATRTVNRKQNRIFLEKEEFYKLPLHDTQDIIIGRLLHNYEGTVAYIRAEFESGVLVNVYVDSINNMIYCDCSSGMSVGLDNTFGILPPLGPLSEVELFVGLDYLRTCINTTIAPRHLRNHLVQILGRDEFKMVQEIISSSWPSVKLLKCERDYEEKTIKCYFEEGRIDRELCWAGQGLQIWFQIVTHLVRLRHTSILVLDEPEVNLHPEKQNDLIQLLKDFHSGSVIVATHSVELMNNVNVSHILHVKKDQRQPLIKSTVDRANLDVVRSQIGSNFNLIASQFEEFEKIVFTENTSDFDILKNLAMALGRKLSAFNIPLYGFSEYSKAFHYRKAYQLMIGRDTRYSMVLDRDYYPRLYLDQVSEEVSANKIDLIYTPGKEIENLFLSPAVLHEIIPKQFQESFSQYFDQVLANEYLDCFGSFLTLHVNFLRPKTDPKTVTINFKPEFDKRWNDIENRHLIIDGKKVLQNVRGFYREKCGENLTRKILVDALIKSSSNSVNDFLSKIFG